MAYTLVDETRPAARAARLSECASCTVRSKSFCGVIPQSGLGDLVHSRGTLRFDKGQTIIAAGARATQVYNVVSGMVKLYRSSADGRIQVVGFRLPGEFFATADLDTYASTAEALENTQVCSFPRARLENLVDRYPELQARMLEMCHQQLAFMEEQMFLLGRKTAAERVASFLLLYGRKQTDAGCDHSASLPITQNDMANFLGLTPETISRVLSGFVRRKLIAKEAGRSQHIQLLDIAALERVAAFTASSANRTESR